MSFITSAYNELRERILEVRTPGTGKQHIKTDIAHVDLYYGQDLDERGAVNLKMPFNLPAVFIEFNDMPMATIGRKVQQSEDSLITIRLVSTTKLPTDSTQDANTRNLALEHFELLSQIHYRLQGFQGSVFGSLDRTGLNVYEYGGHVIRHGLAYRTRFEDDSAQHNTNAAGTLTLNRTITLS